jgi:hypothetical protein
MVDIEFEDALLGRSRICFDGRIIEVFVERATMEIGRRYHSAMVHWKIKPPDRKGVIDVNLYVGTARISQLPLKVDAANFERLRPLLDALHQAGVRIETRS